MTGSRRTNNPVLPPRPGLPAETYLVNQQINALSETMCNDNTRRTYIPKQREFEEWCRAKQWFDGSVTPTTLSGPKAGPIAYNQYHRDP